MFDVSREGYMLIPCFRCLRLSRLLLPRRFLPPRRLSASCHAAAMPRYCLRLCLYYYAIIFFFFYAFSALIRLLLDDDAAAIISLLRFLYFHAFFRCHILLIRRCFALLF